MKTLHALLLLPLLQVLGAGNTAAQATRRDAPVPFVGLAVALSSLPTAFQGCGGAGHATAELRGGLALGPLALEGRGALLQSLGMAQCLNMGGRVELFEEGFTQVVYPFSHSDAHTALDLRLRYTRQAVIPLVVMGGAGWFAPQDVPYVVGSFGVRTRGQVRLAMDVEQSWFRLPYDLVTRTYADKGPGVELSRATSHEWRSGQALRIGTEISLRSSP